MNFDFDLDLEPAILLPTAVVDLTLRASVRRRRTPPRLLRPSPRLLPDPAILPSSLTLVGSVFSSSLGLLSRLTTAVRD